MKKQFFTWIILVSILACKREATRQLPYYQTADFTPVFRDNVTDTFHRIRAFRLTAHTGQVFTEKNMDGKISVVNFFFTSCPGICPRMTSNLNILQDSLRADDKIQLLSHSVTPERDSLPVLQLYAKAHHVNASRWMLLTGNKDEIYNLGRKFYFVEEDLGEKRDTSVFLHTENFILVDRQRHIRGIYNGLSLPAMQNLLADIRVLENEKN